MKTTLAKRAQNMQVDQTLVHSEPLCINLTTRATRTRKTQPNIKANIAENCL